MGEPAERSSATRRARPRARPPGCCAAALSRRGGTRAVAQSGARVVHAHNLQPALGWRALAAARAAGARVVLHLHQYRLVCAVGVCFTRRAGVHALPRAQHAARRAAATAAAACPRRSLYGASLALWQRRLVEQADAVIVPSAFARERLRELGAPLPWERVHVLAPPVRARGAPPASPRPAAVRARRLAAVAREGGRRRDRRLPARGHSAGRRREMARARGADASAPRGAEVRFVGRASDGRARRAACGAALALVPSRSAETFGLAAAEAMAAGLPVAASRCRGAAGAGRARTGSWPPGDPAALAQAIERLAGDRQRRRARAERVQALCSPEVVGGVRWRASTTAVTSSAAARPVSRAADVQTRRWRGRAGQAALITGLTGQDGSFLAELLLEKGYRGDRAGPRLRRRARWARPSICAGACSSLQGDLLEPGEPSRRVDAGATRTRSITSPRPSFVPASWQRPARDGRARSPAPARRSSSSPASCEREPRVFVASSAAMFGDAPREPAARGHASAARRPPTRSRSSPPTSWSARCARTTACTRARGSSSTTSPSAGPSSSSPAGSRAARPRSRSGCRTS